MRIIELELKGYKRLMLNNIKHIIYTPTSIYQLILGTNGSGKSSILEELSPLPSTSKFYIKGGYKKITVEHQDITYILTSVFKSGSGQHSFIKKNGSEEEELNPGSTGQVQKTLVEQVFGITTAIHQLLIGKVKFTALSPAKRREWITMICSADYSYAIGVYQGLRSAARDSQGALKHTKQRLFNETSRRENLEDVEGLEKRYTLLHDELSTLFGEQQRVRSSLDDLNRQYTRLVDNIDQVSNRIILATPTLQDTNESFHFGSLEDVTHAIQSNNTEREVNRALRTQLGKEYQDLSQLVEELKSNQIGDVDNLKEQIAQNRSIIDEKRKQIKTHLTLKADPNAALRALLEASGQLITALKQLPENSGRKYTQSRVEQARKDLDKHKRGLETLQNNIAATERRIHHLESLKKERCPNCSHVWVPGKSEKEMGELQHTLSHINGKLTACTKEIETTQVFLEKADDYRQAFNAIRRLVQEHPRLIDLWDHIMQDSRLMDDPSSLIPEISTFHRELEHHVVISEASEKLQRLNTLLESTVDTGTNNESLEKRLTSLQQDLENVTGDLLAIEERDRALQSFYKDTRRYLEDVERLDTLVGELNTLYDDLMEGERQHTLGQVIREHQNELASLQQRRSEKVALDEIIADLEKDSQQLEIDQKSLALLAATLSPTDGLIAEQLIGFIENFITHVNQFIASVWTYELKVEACGVDSGDLDYKFPFHVNDGKGTLDASDISEGSEAQLEIFNLAFRLVTMLYLKLEEYPLYLDELGRSFDEQHRRNVMDFIKSLTDNANYTQLFMVSHFAAEYGAFTLAEVMVLSGSNITVPKRHNEHVIMN